MVVVAVAGGTGNIGRAIVDALVATGRHEVKVLSRKVYPAPSSNAPLSLGSKLTPPTYQVDPALEAEMGASMLPVDYTDTDALAKVLEDNKIHTVVSGIAMHSEFVNGTVPGEIALIRAADQSSTTKRIISSSWGISVTESMAAQVSSTRRKLEVKEELAKTKTLEHTLFNNGYFMDYWGLPKVPSYLSRMPNYPFWIDMENNAAALPGSGDVPAHFTHTADVARFVAASLDLPKWEPETDVYGDLFTWNEFLRLGEDAKGTKFNVVYDSVEKLKTGQTTELPAHVPLYHIFPKEVMDSMGAPFGLWFEQGMFELKPAGKFLNDQFPEIKPMKVKEMLDKAWRK
ncbi:hypothetical protein RB594_009634 [Gaeumannomyces avenae]